MAQEDEVLLKLLAGLSSENQPDGGFSNVPMDGPIQEKQTLAALSGTPWSDDPMDGAAQEANTLAKLANFHLGAARVNENTGQHGIRAVVENGKVTLTNLTDTGSVIQKGATSYKPTGESVTPTTPDQRGMATNVQGILNQMRGTTDPDQHRGLSAQLNEAMAKEQARMYQDAIGFANNKLQLPLLEQQLTENMALDKQATDYVPGSGDSPITQRIRNQLEQARGLADGEAKRYLQGNVSYNGLVAAEKSAQQESLRISRIADRKDMLEANKEMSLYNRQQARQDQLDEEAKGLTQEQKTRLRMLHPELATAEDGQLVSVRKKHLTKEDGYNLAIDASDDDLPKLAASGNSYAGAILVEKERAAGVDPIITQGRIKQLKSLAANPKAIEQGVKMFSGDDKAAKEAMASLNSLTAPGASKESKQQASMQRLGIAKALLERTVTNEFTADVGKWVIPDPAIQAAITSAQDKVGKKDLHSVMVEYVGAAQGIPRRLLVENFTKYATEAANKTSKSTLGAIDPNRLRLMIETMETRSLIAKLGDNGMFAANPLNSIGPQVIIGAGKAAIGAFSGHNN